MHEHCLKASRNEGLPVLPTVFRGWPYNLNPKLAKSG
jgi:hypothetical protein